MTKSTKSNKAATATAPEANKEVVAPTHGFTELEISAVVLKSIEMAELLGDMTIAMDEDQAIQKLTLEKALAVSNAPRSKKSVAEGFVKGLVQPYLVISEKLNQVYYGTNVSVAKLGDADAIKYITSAKESRVKRYGDLNTATDLVIVRGLWYPKTDIDAISKDGAKLLIKEYAKGRTISNTALKGAGRETYTEMQGYVTVPAVKTEDNTDTTDATDKADA